MFTVSVDKVGEIAVFGCRGKIERADAAYRLLRAVLAEPQSRAVILDLTKLGDIRNVAIGVLWFLQRWADSRRIQFKLFNPTRAVRNRLEHNSAKIRFHIARFDEVMALVGSRESTYAMSA
jgi:hypothetical protein